MSRILLLVASWCVFCAADLLPAAEPNLLLEINGNRIEGTPLSFTQDRVYLLARSGQMIEFQPTDATSFRPLNTPFAPQSLIDVRKDLVREYGTSYEVTGAGHYLVVHPAGQRVEWAMRFEDLYRSFQQYFTSRGFRPQEPRFPLVAVILPKEEFQREALKTGFPSTNGLMGFYSAKTNRIIMFDYAASNPGADWQINAETIIHEAAHQTAFNTGIHARFSDVPRWVTEGLGCLFEAKGVWNSRLYPHRSERINRYRLESMKKLLARRPTGTLAEIVSSDRLLDTNVEAAYAEAWGMTFFFSETEPRKWIEYLKKTATKKPFEHYRSPERLQDFISVFGPDLKMLETRYVRYVNELK